MQRRELLKSLVAIPLFSQLDRDGKTQAAAAAIPPGHYMMFVDAEAVDVESLSGIELPEGISMSVIPVRTKILGSIEASVKIYKLDAKEGV